MEEKCCENCQNFISYPTCKYCDDLIKDPIFETYFSWETKRTHDRIVNICKKCYKRVFNED